MSNQLKGWLAFALWTMWALLVVFAWTNESEPERVPLAITASPSPANAAGILAQADPFRVQVPRHRSSNLPHSPSLNIFAPLEHSSPESPLRQSAKKVTTIRPTPPPESLQKSITAPPPTLSESEVAARRAIQEAEAARQESLQELKAFRFIGFLERNGTEQAFLARGNELFIISNGETIDERFLVTALSASSVTLSVKRTGTEVRIGKSEP